MIGRDKQEIEAKSHLLTSNTTCPLKKLEVQKIYHKSTFVAEAMTIKLALFAHEWKERIIPLWILKIHCV